MSTWYYSDAQRNRLGPVAAADLAALHENGQLSPGTLVWRAGLAEWTPWRDVMGEVLGAGAPTAPPATPQSPVAAPAEAAAPRVAVPNDQPALAVANGYNPYEVVDRVPVSPYAPPAAALQGRAAVVSGGQVLYARFLKRLASNIVDSLVAGIAAYVLLVPVMLAMGAGMSGVMRGGAAMAGLGFGMVGLMYAIQIGVPALYYGGMQSSGWQATLGKRMADIKIARPDGSPIGFWRGFLRHVAFVLSIALTCGLGGLATAIMTVTTERRQGLHDMICDTVVVDQHAFTEHAEFQDESLNTATKVVLGLYALLIVGGILLAMTIGIIGARSQ